MALYFPPHVRMLVVAQKLGKTGAASAWACPRGTPGLRRPMRVMMLPQSSIRRGWRGDGIDLGAGREDRAEVKRVRQHTDDGGLGSIEIDGLAHDGWVCAILPFPKGITEQSDGTAVLHAFVGGEIAAEDGRDAEHREEIAGNREASDGLRLARANELQVVGTREGEVARDLLERLIPLRNACRRRWSRSRRSRHLWGRGGAIQTSCCALGKGSGRSSRVLTTLKTAMLAPMPRARMRMATIVKPRSRRRVRKVYADPGEECRDSSVLALRVVGLLRYRCRRSE